MCDDEDADEAFKSFKPDNIRNHITSALNRKHIFAQPLLAFNVEVGSKLWTKFIEKVEIHQRRPNSEHILNYNFGRLQQKTEWGLGSLEVTMASKLFLNLFWLNSLDQPQL